MRLFYGQAPEALLPGPARFFYYFFILLIRFFAPA
jgi:hypothetical protein